jgi:hypothetical protein
MTALRSLLVVTALTVLYYFLAEALAPHKAAFATTLAATCLICSTLLSPNFDLARSVRRLNALFLCFSAAGVLLVVLLLKNPFAERVVIGIALVSFVLLANLAIARIAAKKRSTPIS